MSDTKLLMQLIQNGDIATSSKSTTVTAIEPLGIVFDKIYHKLDENDIVNPQNIAIYFDNEESNGVLQYVNDLSNVFSSPEELVQLKIIILNGDIDGNYQDGGNLGNRPIVLSNFTVSTMNNEVELYCDFEFFGRNGYSTQGGSWEADGAIKGIAKFYDSKHSGGLTADSCALDITKGWSTISFDSWAVE